ncbi:alpha/beta hydrolase [Streptomyces sp. NPDC090021]|uniref:alpha/beta hydrolase n=1 Tax=Streptomyces sp. NPDC090021 TaxID=3365919 RepID=UPI00380166FD
MTEEGGRRPHQVPPAAVGAVLRSSPRRWPARPCSPGPAPPRRAARTIPRLLANDGYGHTALFNNGSSCVSAYESRYFVDGTLPPPPGTVCRADRIPFS